MLLLVDKKKENEKSNNILLSSRPENFKNLNIIKCYDIASPSINWIWKIILVVMCQFRGISNCQFTSRIG